MQQFLQGINLQCNALLVPSKLQQWSLHKEVKSLLPPKLEYILKLEKKNAVEENM